VTLSVEDLAGMRETLTASLPNTCALITDTKASDGHGGQTATPTVGATIPCRISPRLATGTGQLKDAETIEGERLIAQAPWMVTLSYGVAVDAVQRIRCLEDGREFEAFAVLDPRSWSLDTRILCRLINDGAG
jgi:hypothetical protein